MFALAAVGHALAVEDPLVKADVIRRDLGRHPAPAPDTAIAPGTGLRPLIVFSGAGIDPDSVSSAEICAARRCAGRAAERDLIEPDPRRPRRRERGRQDHGPEQAAVGDPRDEPVHQRRAALLFGRSFGPAVLERRNYPDRDPKWTPTLVAPCPLRSRTLIEIAKLGAELLRPLSLAPAARPAALESCERVSSEYCQ